MIMSTPRLKPDALPTTGDPFDTALIARLANEFFAEGSNIAPTTASAPGVPSPVPSIPTTAAGIPWTQSGTLPDVSDISFQYRQRAVAWLSIGDGFDSSASTSGARTRKGPQCTVRRSRSTIQQIASIWRTVPRWRDLRYRCGNQAGLSTAIRSRHRNN